MLFVVGARAPSLLVTAAPLRAVPALFCTERTASAATVTTGVAHSDRQERQWEQGWRQQRSHFATLAGSAPHSLVSWPSLPSTSSLKDRSDMDDDALSSPRASARHQGLTSDGSPVQVSRRKASSIAAKVQHFLSKENTIAPPNYNRFWNVPFSFMVQVSVGSVYAWSVFNSPLTRDLGVVASAADDWTLSQVLPIFSMCAFTLGLTTAFLGPWAERKGPRMVATAAGLAWGGGLMLTGLGTMLHELPLLYLGYGVFGGIGWGLGYISPVSTLMRWFPDRRGLATGLALTAFGGGAMLATPVNEALFSAFYEMPTYLGAVDSVDLVTENGRRFADVSGQLQEVVIASATDLSKAGISGDAGVYAVGTGSTGAAKTFFALGASYLTLMLAGAMGQRVPPEGWKPEGFVEPKTENKMMTSGNVHYTTALKTPQFYLLWLAVAGNAVAGVTVMSCAKNIMTDVFGSALPHIVTGTFAAGYVAALSGINMVGRLGWAAASDYLGRKNTYFLFGLGIPVMAGLPSLTNYLIENPATTPLYIFAAGTALTMSFYGGIFSVLPAYLADIFGQKHVGAIHGRQLTAWSAAALGGPLLLSTLRDSSYKAAVDDLAGKCDPALFQTKFGAPMSSLSELVDAKTVTIGSLMEIAPAGTLDPTPSLYNTALYSMAGLLTCAVLCNAMIRPVDPKYMLKENKAPPPPAVAPPAAAATTKQQ
ncbi:MFS permease [Salpingoeca rosetta]|uniref:MFS permease n=1 Tax=Salpingoeca rosetta (strain ATCC 50818 / BSB-021) TaxID=946362 RepID=F2U4U4_SALR5|nr:MFS permease [Salpingoeca rosetta]EGD82660.1 MFS permease [Salpingoeca rosetta]|eukprot:XP_004995896.1 MFS permease [Salpingoeca rosetta]